VLFLTNKREEEQKLKILYFGGPTWIFLTPEQMYGEEARLREANKNYQNADIYFLTKMRKVRFDVSKTKVTASGKVQVSITVGDPSGEHETRKLEFSPVELLYSLKFVSQQYASSEHLFVKALFLLYEPKRVLARLAHFLGKKIIRPGGRQKLGISLMKWAYARDLRVKHDSPFELSLIDPLAVKMIDDGKVEEMKLSNPVAYERMRASLDEEWDASRLKEIDYDALPGAPGTLRLTLDQLVNYFGVDVGPQEILYIGKTKRSPFARLLPHKALQEMQAKFLRNEGEAIVAHLFGFKSFDVNNGETRSSIMAKALATTCVEAELINYFKPVMNTHYVEDVKRPTWKHIRTLTARKAYSQIAVELSLDGQYTKFQTKTSPLRENQNRHCFSVNLNPCKRTML
jgi:hypothetical protein